MEHATIFTGAEIGRVRPMPQAAEQQFWEATYWDAVQHRDGRMDGVFYYAVLSTGVYCRPSCHARRPLRENVLFFERRDRAERAGFRACKRCRPQQVLRADPRVELVEKVCRQLEQHMEQSVTLAGLGREFGLSPFHLQRTFKQVTGISPRAYADQVRLARLKTGLREGQAVTRTLYDAGYGSSSRLYERTASQLGMTPSVYRGGGLGRTIHYSISGCRLGKLLVASTDKGICSVQFGETEEELRDALRAEFKSAALIEEQQTKATSAILASLEGHPLEKRLPLDIKATAFQRRVWEHLRSIPRGNTESYSQVAQAIGQPKAVRAVARACASNPAAIAIPCHRVVRNNGELGGYRWKIERKRDLLESEATRGSVPSR